MNQKSSPWKFGISVSICAAAILTLLAAPRTSAAIIYQDSFNGINGSLLDGAAPSTANTLYGGSSSAVWQNEAEQWEKNGIGSVANITGSSSSVLSLNIQSGVVYTIMVDVTTSGDLSSLGFGFVAAIDTTAGPTWYSTNNAGPWLSLGEAGIYTFGGQGTQNPQFSTSSPAADGTYSITLDTTGVQWTYSFAGAGLPNIVHTFSSNPTNIIGIALANDGASGQPGTFNSFQLAATVIPEPSTWAMILGAAAFLTVSRIRKLRING